MQDVRRQAEGELDPEDHRGRALHHRRHPLSRARTTSRRCSRAKDVATLDGGSLEGGTAAGTAAAGTGTGAGPALTAPPVMTPAPPPAGPRASRARRRTGRPNTPLPCTPNALGSAARHAPDKDPTGARRNPSPKDAGAPVLPAGHEDARASGRRLRRSRRHGEGSRDLRGARAHAIRTTRSTPKRRASCARSSTAACPASEALFGSGPLATQRASA